MIKEFNFANEIIQKKILDFLKKSDYSEYTQGIDWFYIRNESIKYFLYYENDNGQIQWVCNLLDKSKANFKCLYAPRGPVLDYSNKKIIELFFKEIKKWMELHNYYKLIINPCISYDILNKFPQNINYHLTDRNDYSNLMDSCKLAIMDIIYDEETLIDKLPSKFRQNTRRSYRKGLSSAISNKIDFTNFYKLYIETSLRHNFHAHDIKYFEKIYERYKENLIFLEVWYNDIPLAMSIDIIYNNKLIYLYGVSSTENRNLLGMYNMQWEAIKYCIRNKISQYDFGGVFCEEDDVDNKDFGLYNFKKGYCYNGFIDVVPDIIIEFGKESENDD